MRPRLAEIMGSLTLFAVGVTLSSGMILGSGSSAISRGVFLVLAATSVLLAFLAMLADGRWRIVRSFLWIIVTCWLGLAVAQIFPTLLNHLPQAMHPQENGAVSLYRHATLQSIVWMSGVVALLLSVSSHVRTGSMFANVTAGLSLVLWGIGLIGFFQTLADRPQLLGSIDLNDPRLPSIVRDIYGGDPAAGMLAYHPWDQVTVAETSFFAPAMPTMRFFGGFLDVRHWGASVAVLLPMLLAACCYYSSFAGIGGFRTHTQSQQSNLFWLVGLCMAGTAAWMADPIVMPAILTISLLWVILFIGRPDRGTACRLGLFYLLTMAGVCGGYWWLHGTLDFAKRYQEWASTLPTIMSLYQQRPLWGTGLATSSELGHPMSSIASINSLAALALEMGLLGISLVGLALLYILIRSIWVYRLLDRDGQIAWAGSTGSLLALALVSLVGPGLDIAVVAGLATFSLGCLMRTLAIGLRDEEALLAT
ncbi:hypothetical protein K2X85_12835 [bacterium]|nr:hypothetical protein [bacterium]